MRALAAVCLHEVVVADAAGDDAQGLVLAVEVFIEGGAFALLLEEPLLLQKGLVVALGDCRKQDEPLRIGRGADVVLRATCVACVDIGAGVGEAGCQAHQDGGLQPFGEVEGILRQPVALLLVRGFDNGYHGEFPVEPAVLLVLGGVH